MDHNLDIQKFRELRAQAADVNGLRQRAETILARRPLRSFDGFGHFLDAVLGDNQKQLDALAQTVRLPSIAIEQLRASELDPFSNVFESVAYLGFLLGIGSNEFSRLVSIDHERFAHHAASIIARSQDAAPFVPPVGVQQLWARFEEDRATAL